jgi:hypothetical protein
LCGVAALLAFALSSGTIITARRGDPIEVAPIKCKEEGSLKSKEATLQTSIVFTNKEDQPVSIYWLDYDGKRIPYGTLGTGQVFSTKTYVTHPWLIADAKGNCKAIYMPTYERLEVNLGR